MKTLTVALTAVSFWAALVALLAAVGGYVGYGAALFFAALFVLLALTNAKAQPKQGWMYQFAPPHRSPQDRRSISTTTLAPR
jgi:hypothetical protein